MDLSWVALVILKDSCSKWVEHGSLLRYISALSLDRAFYCSVLTFCPRHLEIWFFSEILCDRLLLTC